MATGWGKCLCRNISENIGDFGLERIIWKLVVINSSDTHEKNWHHTPASLVHFSNVFLKKTCRKVVKWSVATLDGEVRAHCEPIVGTKHRVFLTFPSCVSTHTSLIDDQYFANEDAKPIEAKTRLRYFGPNRLIASPHTVFTSPALSMSEFYHSPTRMRDVENRKATTRWPTANLKSFHIRQCLMAARRRAYR